MNKSSTSSASHTCTRRELCNEKAIAPPASPLFRSTRIGIDMPSRSVFQRGYDVQRFDHGMSGAAKRENLFAYPTGGCQTCASHPASFQASEFQPCRLRVMLDLRGSLGNVPRLLGRPDGLGYGVR
jgi:hypothetical protein